MLRLLCGGLVQHGKIAHCGRDVVVHAGSHNPHLGHGRNYQQQTQCCCAEQQPRGACSEHAISPIFGSSFSLTGRKTFELKKQTDDQWS
jgi:hypothetical protein